MLGVKLVFIPNLAIGLTKINFICHTKLNPNLKKLKILIEQNKSLKRLN